MVYADLNVLLECIKDVNSLNVINEAFFFFVIAQIKHYSEHLNRGYHFLFRSTVLEGVPIFSYSGALQT